MGQHWLRQRHVASAGVQLRGESHVGHAPDPLQRGVQEHPLCVLPLAPVILLGQDQELVTQEQAVEQQQDDHAGDQQQDHQGQISHRETFSQIRSCGLSYLRHFIPADMEDEFWRKSESDLGSGSFTL